ncbi:MAG: DegT/DnrJ/EryC1/StrS family aminotransferase [Bacteriovoracaceae bacterium]
MSIQVPFVDLKAQYQQVKAEVKKAIDQVLETCQFIQGEFTEQFENNFCKAHGAPFGIGCANGTSAITAALRAMNIGPGDEVITVNNSFFATAEGIAEVGAKIVLVDCKHSTYGIDPELVEQAVNEKTKAIIPVHLYGNSCEMDKIVNIAQKYNLKIMEDCAQAHLAKFKDQAVGTFGEAGTFSFYPGKNLGAYGDAGFITVTNKELDTLVRMHVNHGRIDKYEHQFLASNFRMDGIQAAILDIKLKYLRDWTNKRIAAAKKYDEKLKNAGFKVLEIEKNGECVYHLYVVEVSNRDEVSKALKEVGVSTGVHYPTPLHMQPALKFLGHKEKDFPVSYESAGRILSLPIFPEITDQQINHVMENFLKVAKR